MTTPSHEAPAVDLSPLGGSLLPLARLTPDLERRFQSDYYSRVRPTLRVMAPLLAALFAACAARDYSDTGSLGLAVAQDGAPAVFFVAAYVLTWVSAFGRVWQPALTAAGLATALVSLQAMAEFMAASEAAHPMISASSQGPPSGNALFFGQQVCLIMVCLTVLRLRFRWALALESGVLGAGIWTFLTCLIVGHVTAAALLNFLRPVVAIFAAVILAALVNEQLATRAFAAAHLLEEERNDERRQREQTEGKLHVLAQAIGGIVHDLGSPLTTVQLGAETVQAFLEDETPDRDSLREFAGLIVDGAEMLNALRLSLMEQTRVLEGQPIPVDLRAEPLRPLVAAGARFQSGRATGGRTITLEGDDLDVRADRLKLITVFMNLIGNALKYSDGEVRVVWRAEEASVLVGVLDRGTAGRGVSEAQARRLFVPFGRLEAHAQVEGTGLGLVSVRKIVEAHGGQVFVEGQTDGTPASPPFTTAPDRYPSLLTDGFLTAFVVACPAKDTKTTTRQEETRR